MYSNVSSIGAASGWMNASADNVANINTKLFRPTDTAIVEGENFSPKAVFSKNSLPGTDLAKEMTDQGIIDKTVGLNVSSIKTQDEMMKTVLDIKA